MEQLLELALKRIAELEKKLERYYKMLDVTNELDFVLNGSYILEDDLEKILSGNYTLENKNAKFRKLKTRAD